MPTVVIADDSPTLRRIVSTVLEREGYTVVQGEDGVQAVQLVFRHMPDAVVLDVQMPRVSGYVAARLLKDDWRTADIPILLLTSLDAASDRYWGAQAGADRFLTKDFEAPQLVEAVHEVLSAADAARGGRPPLRPDPVDMQDDDVFGSVSDLLDRKLFESSIAAEVTQIASGVHGFEETIAEVLDVLSRVVDYDLASVLMLDDHSTYIRVARETSQQQYGEFFEGLADAASDSTGVRRGRWRPAGPGRRPRGLPRCRGRGRDGHLPVDAAEGWRPDGRRAGAVERQGQRLRRDVAEHAAAGQLAGRHRGRQRPLRGSPGALTDPPG